MGILSLLRGKDKAKERVSDTPPAENPLAGNAAWLADKVQRDKYRVTYNRKSCIGAGMCAFIDPKRFKMNDDGKADLIGGTPRQEDGKLVLDVEEPGLETIGHDLRRAADSCPAGVIRVERLSDGRKIAGH
jgi:ferredoxin